MKERHLAAKRILGDMKECAEEDETPRENERARVLTQFLADSAQSEKAEDVEERPVRPPVGALRHVGLVGLDALALQSGSTAPAMAHAVGTRAPVSV